MCQRWGARRPVQDILTQTAHQRECAPPHSTAHSPECRSQDHDPAATAATATCLQPLLRDASACDRCCGVLLGEHPALVQVAQQHALVLHGTTKASVGHSEPAVGRRSGRILSPLVCERGPTKARPHDTCPKRSDRLENDRVCRVERLGRGRGVFCVFCVLQRLSGVHLAVVLGVDHVLDPLAFRAGLRRWAPQFGSRRLSCWFRLARLLTPHVGQLDTELRTGFEHESPWRRSRFLPEHDPVRPRPHFVRATLFTTGRAAAAGTLRSHAGLGGLRAAGNKKHASIKVSCSASWAFFFACDPQSTRIQHISLNGLQTPRTECCGVH